MPTTSKPQTLEDRHKVREGKHQLERQRQEAAYAIEERRREMWEDRP